MSTESLSNARPIATGEISCSALFFVFSKLALAGFGGVLPFAYRALVERHRWLTSEEFAELLAISQILPGPTICNVALLVGNRHAGTVGALAAMSGLIIAPFLIVIGLGVVYQKLGYMVVFRHAINGMAAVAAGLILATAIKMALAMYRKSGVRNRRTVLQGALLMLAFAGLGLLKWRLIFVFCALAPLGTCLFYLMEENK